MAAIRSYFRKYPFTFSLLAFYIICWVSLFTSLPIVIGEWPVAPLIAMPLGIIIFLNALFRKQHRYFYLIITAIIILPFFALSLCA